MHVCEKGMCTLVCMSRPEEAMGCSLSFSTYSFEAGSLSEPGAHIFSPQLEARNLPMILSPLTLELLLHAFVWTPCSLPWVLEFRLWSL